MRISKILSILILFAATNIYAQQEIDLSTVRRVEPQEIPMGDPGPAGKELRINGQYMSFGGKPVLPVMGELHFSRMDADYWKDALLKMKATGVNIVSTYCLWNIHEEIEGVISWNGNRDLRRFMLLCQDLGLKVHLRIGPYCNAEIRNGGLPDWIINNPKLKPRTNDPLYLAYVDKWYRSLYDQVEGLLYKDGGPIIGIQLENEYVMPGMIISHLTNLKRMAVNAGFDVPIYSMTHWMDSEYPKGEIIPYAGFYIEAPWTTSGKEEIKNTNFEFFTYNRLSDNIGTNIIKVTGDVKTLNSNESDLPFFTCEIGVGTETFYHRRAVVPKEMAGEMINLRLGSGANLMGYYMYAGGSNPIGKLTTMQNSSRRVNYDYQAPIREFGTMGAVMPEVRKYNYFMNDFGEQLATQTAYLPISCENHDSLQWAVRTDGKRGYLFCSNYLYKHYRMPFDSVDFCIKLPGEEVRIPNHKVNIQSGAYFLWPFNMDLRGVTLKYATAQPICTLRGKDCITYFFFEDDGIPAEYSFDTRNIRKVSVSSGDYNKKDGVLLVNNLKAGKNCKIEIKKSDGSKIRIITLTGPESDLIWRFRGDDFDVVALSSSTLIQDGSCLTVIDNMPDVKVRFFKDGEFSISKDFSYEPVVINAEINPLTPMAAGQAFILGKGRTAEKIFRLVSLSDVEQAFLRISGSKSLKCSINDSEVTAEISGSYRLADVTELVRHGENRISFKAEDDSKVCAEVEILMNNGERIVWNTDNTWTFADDNDVVRIDSSFVKPDSYSPEEHLALYQIRVPRVLGEFPETRMYFSYRGDRADLYHYGQLFDDSFYDGTPWIVSLSRLHAAADVEPLLMRIRGLQSADAPIYFEKNVNPEECVNPTLKEIKVVREFRTDIDINDIF